MSAALRFSDITVFAGAQDQIPAKWVEIVIADRSDRALADEFSSAGVFRVYRGFPRVLEL